MDARAKTIHILYHVFTLSSAVHALRIHYHGASALADGPSMSPKRRNIIHACFKVVVFMVDQVRSLASCDFRAERVYKMPIFGVSIVQ
jgi:hypothetical protein